jgi:hypothetical protein
MSYHRPTLGAATALGGFSTDAKKAITENPDYFVWWYTVKSVGLGVVAAYAAYLLGREHGRRRVRDDR